MKKSRLISIVILIVLLLNTSFVLASADEYNEGLKRGETEGHSAGYFQALELYLEGKTLSYVRPKEDEVRSEFNKDLVGETEIFKSGYINGFYIGHRKGFYEFVNADKTGSSISKPPKVNYGDALGLIYGEIAGNKDYNNGNKSNWIKAIPNNTEIIRLFDLTKETSTYRNYFIRDFRNKFEGRYKEVYEKNFLEEHKIIPETGMKDGETIGSFLGEIYGIKDYHDNKKMDYSKTIPFTHDIINAYSLNLDSPKYKEAFIEGFKKAFREKYNSGYRSAKTKGETLDDSTGHDNGNSKGRIKGEIAANEDYISDRILNLERHRVDDIEVIKDNKLLYQSNNYRQSFLAGYWAGFADAYKNVYMDLNFSEIIVSSVMTEIPMSGGALSSGDNIVNVEIHKGTYYNNVILAIDTFNNSRYPYDDNLIKSSDFHKLRIANRSKSFNNKNPISISFEYYGGRNGGVYKLVNDKWEYLNSKIEEEKISVEINPITLNNIESVYAVFIDNSTPLLYDVRGHWAKDEIQTYIKRGILNGYPDNTFKPNRKLKKGEFVSLINRIYGKEITGNEIDIIEMSASKQNELISYIEVEKTMRKLLGNDTFRWDNIANSMLYDKTTRSKSKDSVYNKITRAEFVYMLYSLNEL